MDSHPLDKSFLEGLLYQRSSDHTAVLSRIEQHLTTQDGYVAFSGGKDSLVTLDLARQVDPNVPVAFFNSGCEFPDTLQFLDDLADKWELNLHIYNARIPLLHYLAGTGAWDYTTELTHCRVSLKTNLIDEPAARAHDDHGPGELWGVRAAESQGRSVAYRVALSRDAPPGEIVRQNGTVAFGPVWNWTDRDIWSYIHAHDLPINPVYRRLEQLGVPAHHHRVGPMIDGNHLTSGRATWLKLGWPGEFEHLATVLPRLREFA